MLGIWEWGCPKLGDAHITVTAIYAVTTPASIIEHMSVRPVVNKGNMSGNIN